MPRSRARFLAPLGLRRTLRSSRQRVAPAPPVVLVLHRPLLAPELGQGDVGALAQPDVGDEITGFHLCGPAGLGPPVAGEADHLPGQREEGRIRIEFAAFQFAEFDAAVLAFEFRGPPRGEGGEPAAGKVAQGGLVALEAEEVVAGHLASVRWD